MRVEQAPSYPATIFIAGCAYEAHSICQDFCNEVGLCVTCEPTSYIYTDGWESGVRVGLINYPRFPSAPHDIIEKASALADRLREGLGQESYSIQTPERTIWRSWRAADNAQGIEARSGETVQQARSEGRKPGPKGAPSNHSESPTHER